MYADFFGLKRRPFRTDPRGTEVFVGPQTARLMKCMTSALVGSDTVVTITGAAGLGKSALTRRALDAHTDRLSIISVPRAQLGHDEVLGFLLEQLGAGELPKSTIRQVLLCRRLIAEAEDNGKPVCVLVEDATRIGMDALVELEALTASDGNEERGGRLVLLGSADLPELLAAAPLARLKQRTRLRFAVEPLNPGEMQGYLRHCFRLAGREFDEIFRDGASAVLFDLTGGVPRLANHLVESVLAAAAEEQAECVDISLIARIARDEYDLELSTPPFPVTDDDVRVAQPSEPGNTDMDVVADGVAVNDSLPDISEFSVEPDDAGEAATGDTDEIPTLFESSRMSTPRAMPGPTATVVAAPPAEMPDWRTGAPTKSPVERPEAPVAPTPASDRANASVPEIDVPADLEPALESAERVEPPTPPEPATVSAEAQSAAGSPGVAAPPGDTPAQADHVVPPAWERDPTLAELRPDIEALELAMAAFDNDDETTEQDADPRPDSQIEVRDRTIIGVPEITLDAAIQEKIAEAQEALLKHDQTIAEEDIEDVPVPPADASAAPRNAPLDAAAEERFREVADGIAKARSIEDVDDKMAETLFGEEFSAIAAQVAANAPDLSAAEDPSAESPIELELADSGISAALPSAAETTESSQQTDFEREFREVYGEDALEVSLQSDNRAGGLDLSASQRLATVRALNAGKSSGTGKFATARAATPGSAQSAPSSPPPQPIEEQITTSMTQTLKALNARPPSANDADDGNEERKGGFFSRFRRS